MMQKTIAYEIDGILYSERDARKKLQEDYGNSVLALSKILVQNVNKYGEMTDALAKHTVLMSKIVKAKERLQEFDKMTKQSAEQDE